MKLTYATGIAALSLLVPAGALQAQPPACSNAIFQGTYFYSLNGSIVGAANQPQPYAETGKLVADGQGGVTGSSLSTQNGVPGNASFTGTYAVTPSCSGTMTLNINSQLVGVNFQVLDNGQSAVLALASTTEVVAGRAVRVTASSSALCSNASLTGAYGYFLTGTAAGLPYTEEGQFTADGAGNLTTSSAFNRNGTLSQSSGAGIYLLSSDCTGTAHLTSPSGNHAFQIALVSGTRTVMFFETDAGAIVTGTAQPATLSRAILPDFISGGGFSTSLYFTNQTDRAVAFTVSFIGDDGNFLSVPALGSSTANVSVAAHGTAILDVPNTGSLVQGYVSIFLPAGVTASGVIRQVVSGRPDEETFIPFMTSSSVDSVIPFDDTGSFATAVAIVNPSAVTATVMITARDLNGNTVGTSMLTLEPQAKTEAVLRNLPGMSGIAGVRGTVDFSATQGNVAVLALRFDGSDFSAIPGNVR